MKIEIAVMLNLERPITATMALPSLPLEFTGGEGIYVTVICVSS